jgi:hypothetical protein
VGLSRNKTVGRYAQQPADRARLFARLADAELQHGHHLAAEFLSRRAEEIVAKSDEPIRLQSQSEAGL